MPFQQLLSKKLFKANHVCGPQGRFEFLEYVNQCEVQDFLSLCDQSDLFGQQLVTVCFTSE